MEVVADNSQKLDICAMPWNFMQCVEDDSAELKFSSIFKNQYYTQFIHLLHFCVTNVD